MITITFAPGALPGDSTKAKIEHVFLCQSMGCKTISLGKSLHRVNGKHVCPVCGKDVDDITFTDLGQSFLQRAGLL
jgi:hypothetical protein